jgi:hypothetical protein
VQPEAKNEPKKRRTEALRIRVSRTERVAIDAAAEATGVGPCTWARVVVVAAVGQTPTPAPRRRRKPSQGARDLAKAIAEIARIGNNLNQVARCANSGFDVDPVLIEEATAELRQLREAIIATCDDDESS